MRRLAGLCVAALLALAGGAKAQEACPHLPPRSPMPRDATPEYLEWPPWREAVTELSRRVLASDPGRARLVFVGDSIFQFWQADIYQQFYAHRAPLNLSIAGDITQGVLWRLSPRRPGPGETAGGNQWPASLKPKLAVLLLGTNNMVMTREAPDIALGVAEVARLIRRRSPTTRVLIVGILPRGADSTEPMRQTAARVNELLARCADGRGVFFTNPGPMLLDGQGRLSELMSPDRLHPSWIGYAVLAAALEPEIRRLMAD